MKRAAAVALLCLALAVSCNPFRRSKPPAPPPAPAPRPVSQPADQAGGIAPPPELPPPDLKLPEPQPPELSVPKPPPPPKPVRKTQPKASPPAPASSPQPAPAAPEVPQLRVVLTAEEQRRLNQTIDARLARARAALSRAPDSPTARQVRTFIDQCEEARKTDLLRAAALAERADLLAQQLR